MVLIALLPVTFTLICAFKQRFDLAQFGALAAALCYIIAIFTNNSIIYLVFGIFWIGLGIMYRWMAKRRAARENA